MFKDQNEYKSYHKMYRQLHKEKKRRYMQTYAKNHKEELTQRVRSDKNLRGQTKASIRTISRNILFKRRKHTQLENYEIHHCFGYNDPTKFIYIPKQLHLEIHQLLRDLSIKSDTNHWDIIKNLVNTCNEYTYISV